MSAALLERLGPLPRTIVHLDFETFYSADYTLRKLTTEAYVRDERFQVIGVGVRVGKSPSVWLEEWEFRAWASRVDWSRCAVNAHHAQFDGAILAWRYGIKPAFWFCTMSMGRKLYGEGGLDRIAQRLGIGAKSDGLAATKGKRREEMTQAEWRAFGDYCRNDVDLSAELLRRMVIQIPRTEWWLIDTTIRMFTEPTLFGDVELLGKTLAEERAKKAVVLDSIMESQGAATPEAARVVLASSDKFAALLRSIGVEPPTKLNPKSEEIYAFAKSDPGMAALLEHDRDEVRFLAEARLSVKSTLIETRVERLIGIAQRGPVPFYLKWCGAHTDRWSGGDKMNPQNFNRGGALRDAIIAAGGDPSILEEVICVVDSSQIEARVLPWLAGETKLIETFRRNDKRLREGELEAKAQGIALKDYWRANGGEPDFYSDAGSELLSMKISKADTPTERQVAKGMILGLGFQMGWEKFGGEQLKGLLGAAPVQFGAREVEKFRVDVGAFERRPGGDRGTCGERTRTMIDRGVRLAYFDLLVHCAVADHFVRAYRARYSRISALWKTCEEILSIMENPEGDPDAVRMTFRGLKVMRHRIQKPNGLTLRYPGLRRRAAGGFTYLGGKSGREVSHIYGGLLTENLVQSLARDIVAEQVLWIRSDGYRIATTTHDEIVSPVLATRGPSALADMIARMSSPPEWCSDLPLNAAGGIGRRYGDAK
jgi:DNA polymerase